MFVVPCDKEELCDNTLFISQPQLVNECVNFVLQINICSEIKNVQCIVSEQEELKLLSSLNTLGYIEFDVLCDLNSLEENLKLNSDLSCLSQNTFHVIGKYNDKLEYMVHRVYICSNL